MLNNDDLKTVYNKIKEADNILLTTHERPDGDAYASVCAMIEIIEALGKNATAYIKDGLGTEFEFLPHIEKIIVSKAELSLEDYDLVVILDSGSLARTNLEAEIKSLKKNIFIIDIDHHPYVDIKSQIEIRNTEAVSTTEIIYDFIKANKIKITKNIANCILTGLLHDTDNFFHQTVTEKPINIASEMLIFGAQFPKITTLKWRNKSLDSMRLWGMALTNLRINKKYNIAYSFLTLDDVAEFDINDDIFNSITNYISNLEGVNVIMFLREEIDKATGQIKIKGSLRSTNPQIDVSELAQKLGGGGHPMASGFSLEGKLEKNESGWTVK